MKALRIFLLVLIIIGLGMLVTQKLWVPKLVNRILLSEGTYQADTTPKASEGKNTAKITITTKNLKEENFSGKVSTISGSSKLAVEARKYVDESVASFRKQANEDVPGMREEFGADSPTAMYEVNIDAKHIKGGKTESIVMLDYTYTGGAHGNSLYKVITSRISDGKILSLGDIIKADKKIAFTDLVKKELNAWRPNGSEGSVVFPDSVKDLTFDSFTEWSLDDKNLIIYFGQYEIGPGVLGAAAFPVSRSKLKDFLID